jgi:hypothetical protein
VGVQGLGWRGRGSHVGAKGVRAHPDRHAARQRHDQHQQRPVPPARGRHRRWRRTCWPLVRLLVAVLAQGSTTRYRRGRISQKGHFYSLPRPILPTRSMWQLWASETLHERMSNASVTLQKRSTRGLHLLLDVIIHFGRFHQGYRTNPRTSPPAGFMASGQGVVEHY